MPTLTNLIRHSKPSLMPLIITLTLLSGCTEAIFNACPPITDYDATFQQQAYAQASAMPPDSPIWIMLNDYERLRNELRACEGK